VSVPSSHYIHGKYLKNLKTFMKHKRNLSPHIVAEIAAIKIITPPIDNTTVLGGMRMLNHTNGIINTKANRAPRIAPKINLRINTVTSVLLLMCYYS
jgi:hypothetical protein